MQISNYLKNKFLGDKKYKKQEGFTILECILAVGILSAVLANLVALQSSIIYVAVNSMDKLKAVWSMKQAMSQVDYLLQAGGFNAVNESSSFAWSGDPKFNVVVSKKDLKDVKPSQFLLTAVKFFQMTDPSGNEHADVKQSLTPINDLIDNAPIVSPDGVYENTALKGNSNQGPFANVFVTVNWTSGTVKNTFTDGLFLIDSISLSKIKLPDLGGGNKSSPNEN